MQTYQAPIRDMQFVLHELLNVEQQFAALKGFEDATADTIDIILEEAGKFCEGVLFPLNAAGDAEGCRFADRCTQRLGVRMGWIIEQSPGIDAIANTKPGFELPTTWKVI